MSNADGYFEFFPPERISDALQLLVDAWRQIPPPKRTDLEDTITGPIAAVMNRNKTARRLGFNVHFQYIPLSADAPSRARIDITLIAGYDGEVYLALECKRLRIPRRKLDYNTEEYVGVAGMGRFAAGKYSSTQEHGVMVGYVMDGNVAPAKQSIWKLIEKQTSALGLESTAWETSAFLNHPDIHQTFHRFPPASSGGIGRRFAFQHVFLGLLPALPTRKAKLTVVQ